MAETGSRFGYGGGPRRQTVRRARSANLVVGIGAGHEAIPVLLSPLQNGRDPRQTLSARAARRHPDLAQPGAPPAPRLGEQPLAPQVPAQLDLVVANAQRRRLLPAQVDAFVQTDIPLQLLPRGNMHLCFEGCTSLFG